MLTVHYFSLSEDRIASFENVAKVVIINNSNNPIKLITNGHAQNVHNSKEFSCFGSLFCITIEFENVKDVLVEIYK